MPSQQLIDLTVGEGQSSVAVADEQQELVSANLTRTLGWMFTRNVEKLHNVTVDNTRVSDLPYGTNISFKATPAVMDDVWSKLLEDMLCGYHNEMPHDLTGDVYRAMCRGTDETGKLGFLLRNKTPRLLEL